MIQRSVTDAARLLGADRAQVNLVTDGGAGLDRPIAAAPDPPSPDDVTVPVGSGIAGRAAADKSVCWTGDYLVDESFPHDEGDERIRAQGIRSMMSAPLMGPDRLIGTITVQSSVLNAFDADDGVLLKLLADQVEIPAFGDTEEVDPDFPARFDLLALETGSFPVRLVEADRVIARIDVGAGQAEGDRSNDSPGRNNASSDSGASAAS